MRINTERAIDSDESGSDDEMDFSSLKMRRGSLKSKRRSAELHEVVDLSPGGHVTKRRTRSRPVSLELVGSPKPLDAPDFSMPPPPALF